MSLHTDCCSLFFIFFVSWTTLLYVSADPSNLPSLYKRRTSANKIQSAIRQPVIFPVISDQVRGRNRLSGVQKLDQIPKNPKTRKLIGRTRNENGRLIRQKLTAAIKRQNSRAVERLLRNKKRNEQLAKLKQKSSIDRQQRPNRLSNPLTSGTFRKRILNSIQYRLEENSKRRALIVTRNKARKVTKVGHLNQGVTITKKITTTNAPKRVTFRQRFRQRIHQRSSTKRPILRIRTNPPVNRGKKAEERSIPLVISGSNLITFPSDQTKLAVENKQTIERTIATSVTVIERTTTLPVPVTIASANREAFIPNESGLRPVRPPAEIIGLGGFGSSGSIGGPFRSFGDGSFGGGSFGGRTFPGDLSSPFTGQSALAPNFVGPSGDGFNPPLVAGVAAPPPVSGLSFGGGAAGIPPPAVVQLPDTTQNPPSTLHPSALLQAWNKADQGFNQAIQAFERASPVETAAIDILEVALGSRQLESQARLLGHVDRTLGLDNLKRLQRWANTGGALDHIQQQIVKIAQNYRPPDDLPNIPGLNYLLSYSGKKRRRK